MTLAELLLSMQHLTGPGSPGRTGQFAKPNLNYGGRGEFDDYVDKRASMEPWTQMRRMANAPRRFDPTGKVLDLVKPGWRENLERQEGGITPLPKAPY